MKRFTTFISAAMCAAAAFAAPQNILPELKLLSENLDSAAAAIDSLEQIRQMHEYLDSTYVARAVPLPNYFFTPAVFITHEFYDAPKISDTYRVMEQWELWADDQEMLNRNMIDMQQRLFFSHPEIVRYNIDMLPEAPKKYFAEVNPEDHTITISELVSAPVSETTLVAPEIKKKHWIRTFDASLQFSQAYVSPNWYQGGNNNLNMLANIYYNVKLNQEFHPNLLFETTAQYKLGMNNAPDDSIHAFNISDDLFQLNTTFGLKAAKRWYYSFTGQFKTQLLNSYKSNTHEIRSAFLSPAELTAGIGMTYNYANTPKTFTFDASIAPISYNMKMCVNHRLDPELFDIDAPHRFSHKFGSSTELKLYWKMCYNIYLRSRIFSFTDFSSIQVDWENTMFFELTRFLTTQIYAHARYDSATLRRVDTEWHKFQLKEIFSIGFSYKFSSI